MGDKGLRLGLSGIRIAVIVAGILLSYMITSRSGSDETFVEGQERYGALLDGLFYIIYFVGIACAAAAIIFGLIFFCSKHQSQTGDVAGRCGIFDRGIGQLLCAGR